MNWRTLTWEVREQFLAELTTEIRERQKLGVRQYGAEFQGEPLQQAWEEALDLVFYLWIERLRRNNE